MPLKDFLYTEHTIPDALKKYISELSISDSIADQLRSNKMMQYKNMILDKNFLSSVRKFFNQTYKRLDEKFPELYHLMEGRRKSATHTDEKIILYSSKGLSLDLVRDFFAFRIILFGNLNNLEEYCYKVAEEIIDFAATKGFVPCERLPLIDAKLIHQNGYFSKFKYKEFIKDYICFPKGNGYKSIHLVLVDTKGRYLEIQIRTIDMHLNAEKGSASHSIYKQTKYNSNYNLNRELITIDGYKCYSIKNQILDLLKEKHVSEELMERTNELFKDNIVSLDNINQFNQLFKDKICPEELTELTNRILTLEDQVIDLAGVEEAISIFRRQKTF